jgi:hypothetical protein
MTSETREGLLAGKDYILFGHGNLFPEFQPFPVPGCHFGSYIHNDTFLSGAMFKDWSKRLSV